MTLPEAAHSRNRFSEVIDLIARAEYGRAEQLCTDHLRQHAEDVNILGLKGAVLIKLHRLEEAIEVLRRVVQLAPTFAKPQEDLGLALFETGRFDEARPVLENAVRLDPSLELAWLNLGKTIAALGDGRKILSQPEFEFAASIS
jgi:Flp pilus assembly protein TadD